MRRSTGLNPAANNDWNDVSNWNGGNVPNANTEQAVFGASNITTINLPTALTIQKLTFNASAPAYTFIGSALTIDVNTTATTADAILVGAGTGIITLNNALVFNDTNATGGNIAPSVNVGAGSTLTLNGAINSTGRNLPFPGAGVVNVFGAITAGGGQIQHNGNSTVNLFTNPVSTGQIRSFSNTGSMNIATSTNRALGIGVTGGTSHFGRIFLTANGIVSSGAVTQGGGSTAGTNTLRRHARTQSAG